MSDHGNNPLTDPLLSFVIAFFMLTTSFTYLHTPTHRPQYEYSVSSLTYSVIILWRKSIPFCGWVIWILLLYQGRFDEVLRTPMHTFKVKNQKCLFWLMTKSTSNNKWICACGTKALSLPHIHDTYMTHDEPILVCGFLVLLNALHQIDGVVYVQCPKNELHQG